MGGSASSSRGGGRDNERDFNRATKNGTENVETRTRVNVQPAGAVKPKTRDDLVGAAEFNELGVRGQVANDIAMIVGAKPKDESFNSRTGATKVRNSETAASAAAARSSAREGDERDASGKRIRDLDYVAPTAASKAAPAAAGTAAAAGSKAKVTPPDPDVLALAANAGNAGAAETAVMEGVSAADATATLPEAKPIPKLGRKSTIATSNKGITDEPEPEPEPAATASKTRKADRDTTIATTSQGLLSQTQPSLRRRRSLMGMIK